VGEGNFWETMCNTQLFLPRSCFLGAPVPSPHFFTFSSKSQGRQRLQVFKAG